MVDLKDEDFIKKSRVAYLQCTEGDLHEGELMTLVCVQQNCPKKGLICPVCRVNEHDKHKTIPLKVFLTEIRDKFVDQKNKSNQSNFNSLSDYLVQLDKIRQQLLTTLKDVVSQIADKVKKVEQQIVENYANIRKLVLTQSTISVKLPGLISMMLDPKDRDPKQIQQQFKKYASLLHYQKNEITFQDSSKKIIEQYSQLPSRVGMHLSALLPSLTKTFDVLPLSLNTQTAVTVSSNIEYSFSNENKIAEILLSQNNKVAEIDPNTFQTGGYVVVKEGAGIEQQSISFRIVSSDSDCISLGLGLPQSLRNKNFILDQIDINHGLYSISAMGFTYQSNNVQKQQNDVSFPFGVGDTIDITWNAKTKQLDFYRRHGVQKYTIQIDLPEIELAKLQFTVGFFGSGDKVAIVVDQE